MSYKSVLTYTLQNTLNIQSSQEGGGKCIWLGEELRVGRKGGGKCIWLGEGLLIGSKE